MTSYRAEEQSTMTQSNEALPSFFTSGLIGLAGGIVGGLLGGGGGVVTVPALDRVTDLPRAKIHGTATLSNVVIALVGTAIYSLHGGTVDLRVGIGLMLGGVIGGTLGARLAAYLPERALRLLFVAVLLISGVKLLFDGTHLAGQATSALLPAQQLPLLPLLLLTCLFGILIGAWSGSMGLGGGLLAIPTLVLIFGVSQHPAEGTSLLLMIPNTIAGSITHLRQGTASFRLGRMLSLGAFFGAALGVWIAFLFSNQVLQLVFGSFVLLMALREGYRFVRRLRSDQKKPDVKMQ
jgi:uncharacterized membrane protein YfcA